MKSHKSTGWRRATAGLVAVTLAVGPAIQAARAASTELSDLPIASKVTAKPNILYTLDDSGSMSLNYIPAYTVNSYYRGGAGTTTCTGGFPGPNNCAANFYGPPFLDSDFNHMAYNPNVTYTAPIQAGGASYPDQNAAQTTNWTKVQSDPYLSPATTVSLTPMVAVQVFCDSDWPLTTTVGNANGEYLAGTGADCRINGTKYDAAASTGAPAATDDYNYPWQNNVAPGGAQYFYRGNGAAKSLWCNTASASWPVLATINNCNAGAGGTPITTTTTTTTQQTCNRNGFQCNPRSRCGTTRPLRARPGPSMIIVSPAPAARALIPQARAPSPSARRAPAITTTRRRRQVQLDRRRLHRPYGVLGGDLGQCPNIVTTTTTTTGCTCVGGGNACIVYDTVSGWKCRL